MKQSHKPNHQLRHHLPDFAVFVSFSSRTSALKSVDAPAGAGVTPCSDAWLESLSKPSEKAVFDSSFKPKFDGVSKNWSWSWLEGLDTNDRRCTGPVGQNGSRRTLRVIYVYLTRVSGFGDYLNNVRTILLLSKCRMNEIRYITALQG